MAEFIFRAKQKDNEEWVIGGLVVLKDYLSEKDFAAIIPVGTIAFPHSEIGEWIEVIPETVCQCVGLRDADGNYIFEGDILESPVKRFGAEHGNLIVVSDIRECRYISLYVGDYKVIGNIFDNPSLGMKYAAEQVRKGFVDGIINGKETPNG